MIDKTTLRGLVAARRTLAILYFAFAFPVVLTQVFATPPLQMPDEPHHFMRIVQIADGVLLARRLGEIAAGGDLEQSVEDVALTFRPLAHDLSLRFDTSLFKHISTLQWGESARVSTEFSNTAIYPPFLYIPAAMGVEAGRAMGLPILQTYYLSRLFNAVCTTLLAALAIGVCAKGRGILAILMSLPMVLSAFASVSQDAMSFVAGALAVAVWSRYLARGLDVPLAIRAGVSLLVGAIVAGRIPLCPLFGMLLLPTGGDRKRWPDRHALLVSAAGLIPVAFGIACANAAKVAFRPGDGVSPIGQISTMVHKPSAFFDVMGTTLNQSAGELYRELVTVLGWWANMLPPWYYGWAAMFLIAAAAVEALAWERGFGIPSCVLQTAAAVAGAICVFLTMYVAWTPVGGSVIDGLQGRYFLVCAIFLAIAVPSSGRWGVAIHAYRRPAVEITRMAVCLGLAVVNLWAVPITLLTRYYL